MIQKIKNLSLILGLLILALIFFILFIKANPYKSPKLSLPEQLSEEITTKELKNYKVPERGEKLSENNSVPIEVSSSSPKSSFNYRFFEIRGEKNMVFPQEIIVYQNDIVNLKLSAIDGDYDFTIPAYGIFTKVTKGDIKTIEFQAINVGKFPFLCELCLKKVQGYLIVVPKS